MLVDGPEMVEEKSKFKTHHSNRSQCNEIFTDSVDLDGECNLITLSNW